MKVAVIGTGFGERVVAVVWRRLGWEVTVISPRDTAAIQAVCASGVDLVSVHSPPFLHHDHVMMALKEGRNVLCDKPFGRDASEARAMRDAANARGVLHFLNFEFRTHPSRQKAKALLREGRIGDLRHVNWTFIGSGLRRQRHRWLFEQDKAGGWIGAYGSHAIDTLRFLYDAEVAQCGGMRRTETLMRPDRDGRQIRSTAEDAYSSWFVMENGCTASMDTAFSSAVNLPQRINLLGSYGAIEIVDDTELILHSGDGAPEHFQWRASDWDAHEPALVPWLASVGDAVREGRQLRPSFDDGLAVAETMDVLRRQMIDLRIQV